MFIFVFWGCQALDTSVWRIVHLAQHAVRRFAEYLAAFKTAIGARNDSIATRVVGSGIHHEQSTHQTASNDIPGHTNLGRDEEWQAVFAPRDLVGLYCKTYLFVARHRKLLCYRQHSAILVSYVTSGFWNPANDFEEYPPAPTWNCTMPFPASPEDRPDPLENMPAMRARIPEHVARGEVSTGVIVVTGGTEYVLDFVRNLPRPNMIVARVVLPHMVMPQFIDALAANVELFRQRYGELPGAPPLGIVAANPAIPGAGSPVVAGGSNSVDVWPGSNPVPPAPNASGVANPAEPMGNSLGGQNPSPQSNGNQNPPSPGNQNQGNPQGAVPNQTNQLRRQNPQEVYDDLKLRDDILSGAYANAVMIGHGPYEFSFDFITNFYPQSAVSCRVYLASGHIYRLLESLRASWEQLRPRLSQGHPPTNPPQNLPPSN